MKANVVIEKSFDGTNKFTKDHEAGDFAEFFSEEGEYLDELARITKEYGANGDKFTVTYTVTVEM